MGVEGVVEVNWLFATRGSAQQYRSSYTLLRKLIPHARHLSSRVALHGSTKGGSGELLANLV